MLSVVYLCGQHHAIKSQLLATMLLKLTIPFWPLHYECVCEVGVCQGEGMGWRVVINLSWCIYVCVLVAGGLVVSPQTGAWGFTPFCPNSHSLIGCDNFGRGPKTKIGMACNNKLDHSLHYGPVLVLLNF